MSFNRKQKAPQKKKEKENEVPPVKKSTPNHSLNEKKFKKYKMRAIDLDDYDDDEEL
ncbi:MAG: hypothetical protein KDD32_01505 [Bacteroidetes bacterium]|nr:hypothetical protein [Bacteroidota bacterium]